MEPINTYGYCGGDGNDSPHGNGIANNEGIISSITHVPYVGVTDESLINLTVLGNSLQPDVTSGVAGYHESCEGNECTLELTEFTQEFDEMMISVQGATRILSEVRLRLNRTAKGTYNPNNGGVDFPEGSFEVLLEFTVLTPPYFFNGDYGNIITTNNRSIIGFFNPDADTFTLLGEFIDEEEGIELDFILNGHFIHTPPVISTVVPVEPVECDGNYAAQVPVDGSGTYDKDGPVPYHWWWVGKDNYFQGSSRLDSDDLSVDIGTHLILHRADSARFVPAFNKAFVTVQDTTPPYFTMRTPDTKTCVPAPSWVSLERIAYSVSDICTDDDKIELTGKISTVNNIRMEPPITIPTNTNDPNYIMVYLPLGTHEVRWSATDEFGNATTLTQEFTVEYDPGLHCCNRRLHTIWEGTDDPDYVYVPPTMNPSLSYCAFLYDSMDVVLMADPYIDVDVLDDYINFGEGGTLTDWGAGFAQLRPGQTTIVSDSGDDIIIFNPLSRQSKFYDIVGDDDIEGSKYEDIIYGGSGHDFISSNAGNDFIVPGPGSDRVYAGEGDDEIFIYNICEISPEEHYYGGPGFDILYLPIEYRKAVDTYGLLAVDIEKIIVDDSMRGYSDCAIVYP